MGYCVDIQRVKFEHKLETLPEDVDGYWKLDTVDGNKEIEPIDWSFNWHEEDFEKTLILLAKAGVTGEVEFMGEQGDYWKYELKDKKVAYYDGKVVYSENPQKVLGIESMEDHICPSNID